MIPLLWRHANMAIPDYIFRDVEKSLKESGDQHLLPAIQLTRKLSKQHRKERNFVDSDPGVCSRYTYDAENKEQEGTLKLTESSLPGPDEIVNLAHSRASEVRYYFRSVLGRNSYDNRGSDLRSTVHYGENYCNAFFDGEKMTYGDGDDLVFLSFAKSLDVAAHEMGHGVVQSTAGLKYFAEPGALNEHYADVFGITCKHFQERTAIPDSVWLIGSDIVGPKFPGVAIRSFKNEKAYSSDPQPKHRKKQYYGLSDNGGVHINSGIPNHAFYLFCTKLFEQGLVTSSYQAPLTMVWYPALQKLGALSGFKKHRDETLKACKANFPEGLSALRDAWKAVGL